MRRREYSPIDVIERRTVAPGAVLLFGIALLVAVCYRVYHPDAPGDVRRHWAALLRGAQYRGLLDVTLQTHQTNCGPAALHMALASLGIDRSLAEIEAFTGTDRSGTSLFALKQYAERQGARTSLWRLNLSDLVARNGLPAIAFVRENHFVVIDSIKPDGSVLLRDPAIGRLHMTRTAWEQIWRGEVMLLDAP